MQSARTPSSILRKRANKENEGKENKRNKLRGRRVSFAPDEELETMHLYQKDKGRHDDDDMQLTEDLAARMPQALSQIQAGAAAAGGGFAQQNMSLLPTSPGGLGMLSPMSMDLTNNSMDLQHAGVQPVQQPADFTRSITGAIPALSTLVEEDEEGGLESMSFQATPLSQQQHAMSPAMTMSMDLTGPTPRRTLPSSQQALDQMGAFTSPAPSLAPLGGNLMDNLTPTSPFVLNEMMGARSVDGGVDDTDDLKNKWGFTPGKDDTLDASHGRLVMGDTTYNHVYGNATTGDITNAMRVHQTADGPARTATSRMAIAATANAAAGLQATMQLPARSVARMQQSVPQAEMTINLLAEEQTDLWHQPLVQSILPAGRPSIGSSKPAPPSVPSDTTNLLGGNAPTGRTATNFTMQLLAEGTTTKGVLEQYMQRVQAGRPQQAAILRHEPFGASTSMAGAGRQPSQDGTIGSLDFALAAQGGNGGGLGLLDEAQLTLDDFGMPPELAATNRQSSVGLAGGMDGNTLSLPLSQQLALQQLGSQPSQQQQGHRLSQGYGMQGAASAMMPAPEPELPPITFQEFLGLVEVRFLDDMRRRTSFVQPFEGLGSANEPAPSSLPESLEAVHITNVRGALTHHEIEQLAERVEGMQMRLVEAEMSVARANPRVFQIVQVAGTQELDRVRDQVKLLKRLCRARTMMAWKQMRIGFEQSLSSGYRAAMGDLEGTLNTMQAALAKALEVEAAVSAAHGAILSRVQQEHTDFQVAQAAKERQVYTQQRMQDMMAANTARQQKLDDLNAHHSLMQSKYEEALQQKAELQRTLQALQGKGVAVSTPGQAAKAASKVEVQLVEAQQALDIVTGLQHISLDTRALRDQGSWSMSVHGQFSISVEMRGADGQPGAGVATVRVAPIAHVLSASPVASAVLPALSQLCAYTTTTPTSRLPQVLDTAMSNVGHAAAAISQLETALLQWPALVRMTAAQGSGEVTLHFTVCDAAVAKVAVTLPVLSLCHSRVSAAGGSAGLTAQVVFPASVPSGGIQAKLQAVQPGGTAYLQQLCRQVTQMLADGLTVEGSSGTQAAAVVFDNPLFA